MYHWCAGLVVTGEYMPLDKTFYSSETRSCSSPSYFHIFFLLAFLEETFMRTIIIIICNDYTIIICINDNAVINNNYGRLQGLVFLFKILMGTQQDFFEIHRQFGHVPSKSFASHGLDLRSGLYKHVK
jgi:hypothetical protein